MTRLIDLAQRKHHGDSPFTDDDVFSGGAG